jgi:predicted DNA-binding protein (MmcQ/YjbR family)
MAKENVTEEYPWGDIVWKVKGKMFAATGQACESVTVKSTLDKQAALIQHPDIEVAQYVGRYGWVTVRLASEETFDLALELGDESYESVTAKKKRG